MAPCSHVQWIELDGIQHDWSITYASRLASVVAELPRPGTQFPSIIFYVGSRLKATVLSRLYPGNTIHRRDAHGIANLYLDRSSIQSSRPGLFADCTINASHTNSIGSWSGCHDTVRYRIDLGAGGKSIQDSEIVSTLQRRLLFRFAHVVCLFADDFQSAQDCVRYITKWMLQGLTPTSPPAPLPQLLVVVSNDRDVEPFMQMECLPCFDNNFSSLSISVLEKQVRGFGSSSFDLFVSTLASAVDDACKDQQEARFFFSATHLNFFFGLAMREFAWCPSAYVSYEAITDAKIKRQGIVMHASRFVLIAVDQSIPVDKIAAFIATALLAASYPPGSHYFSPETVFDTCYRRDCLEMAGNKLDNICTPTEFSALVRATFVTCFHWMSASCTSLDLRREFLSQTRPVWTPVCSMLTCLLCLQSPPERPLQCQHAICEECVRAYYPPESHYTYVLQKCNLCDSHVESRIRLKPPTASPSLLSVEGGGIRGIVALVLLSKLFLALGGRYPIGDYFDFIVGTSAGALIVLDIMMRETSLDESLVRFETMARHIFQKQNPSRPCFKWLRVLNTWFHDGKYDADVLEDVLQSAFGSQRRLFDAGTGPTARLKIGIMATSVANSELRIFTNYNGVGQKSALGYAHLRPEFPCDEPYLWEVARCTVAAPRPKYLRGLGIFYDGGMKANNPTEPGLWELQRLWPTCSRPAVVISVGTGYHPNHLSATDTAELRSVWLDGYFPRSWRAFMLSTPLHGQNAWLALLNSLDADELPDYHRLNVEFDTPEPDLDDPDHIPSLKAYTQLNGACPEPARNTIWAAQFYFELQSPPEKCNGYYVCHGMVLCKLPDARGLVSTIRQAFSSPMFVLDGEKVLIDLTKVGCCGFCGTFAYPVVFDLRQLDISVDVSLAFNKVTRCHISSFPKSMRWFMRQQLQELSNEYITNSLRPCCRR